MTTTDAAYSPGWQMLPPSDRKMPSRHLPDFSYSLNDQAQRQRQSGVAFANAKGVTAWLCPSAAPLGGNFHVVDTTGSGRDR
jgi:hypothetical protein